ncbi:MAG: type II secretion system protein M [Syntrophobacterales bacterium]|nr:type II secretion system protein M [Syntrophobacterales bacterium]
MKQFWEQLTKSQKRALTIGLIFVAGAVIMQFAVFPWIDARQRVRTSIATNEKTLRELATLGREYAVLRRSSEAIKDVVERRLPGFALFSYLERKASENGLKAHIKSINPLKPTAVGAYEETAVEIKVENLTSKQLTDFLYNVESPEQMVRIRRLSIGKMKEAPEYLVAEIQVYTYQNPSGEGRAR